jgi:protein-S-isoprenylcysteine O-methyltransferase Ste14
MTGILGVIRHPWYVGGMLIVWARPLDISAIITNTIITGYFVVGAILEERKLRRVFGDAYREYQEKVSMFFPCKWLKVRFRVGRD